MIGETILNYNLFEQAQRDEYSRRNEILSTRLYIFLMISGIAIIVLYASIVPYTLINTVR